MSYVENDDFLEWVLDKGHRSPLVTHKDMVRFYPSSTSAVADSGKHFGNCVRSMYYSRAGTAPDPGMETDVAGYMIMGAGTAIGDRLANIFNNAGVAVMPIGTNGEQRVYIDRVTPKGNKYSIAGYIDMICRGHDNELIGYEFKTVWSAGKANRVIKGWRCTPEPDPKNVMQTAIYAAYTREHHGILDWRLTYFHVESKKARTYHITVDADWNIYINGNKQAYTVHSVYAQYDKLADALIEGTPPDEEGELWLTDAEVQGMAMNGSMTKKQDKCYNKMSKVLYPWSPCTYCNYIGTCKGTEDMVNAAEARNLK